MLIRRAIVAIPALPAEPISKLRRRYDPLTALIPPHLTLVFPFESALSPLELQHHVTAAVAGIAPLPLRLAGITGNECEYLFLNVKRGNDALIELHDRLYTGPLSEYRSIEHTFVPHLTIGRLPNLAAFRQALALAATLDVVVETVVAAITIYRVEADGARPVERCIPLAASPGIDGSA